MIRASIARLLVADLWSLKVKTISGEEQDLSPYKGKVLLIVNTASQCGFTPQYDGLEQLWRKHKDAGFAVLGFPCNQFGGQEPGNEAEIGAFCKKNFGVSFPLHSKIDVNGAQAHPLFDYLKKEKPGFLGFKGIKWNFTKFLVDRSGKVVERFGPTTKPEAIEKRVAELLAAPVAS